MIEAPEVIDRGPGPIGVGRLGGRMMILLALICALVAFVPPTTTALASPPQTTYDAATRLHESTSAPGRPDDASTARHASSGVPSSVSTDDPTASSDSGVATESGSALARASHAAFRAADDPASIFVKNKHMASAGGNSAKFASDDIGQVQGWISRGLQSDGVQFLPNQLDDTFRAIVPGGGVVGTRGQEFIRVIVTGDSRVINAFQVNVR